MPEFFPEHVTPEIENSSPFLAGYLGAAEWLIRDPADDPGGGIDRKKIRGWSRAALGEAVADCLKFVETNSDDLLKFYALTGRGADLAGYCFYLSRNHHGAGFFDRGDDEIFDRLQDAAGEFGERDVYLYRGWLHFQPG